ncbi:MAG: thiol:disulfide interchange protein DsbA/DsbL, partial [Pseudoxanthomonas sp.]
AVAAPAAAAAAPAPAEAANTNPVAPPQGPAPVEGSDYTLLGEGQTFDPADGRVEVAEVFNYICPACAAFQPAFDAWKAKLPADVRVVLVPAQFRDDFRNYAKVYYAAEALGVAARTHDAMYQAIHQDKTLPGEGEPFDLDKVAQFYQAQAGIDPATFKQTYASFAVAGKLGKANQFALRSQIAGTPSIVIAGKYLVKGKTYDDALRIADHLIARERAAGTH